MVRIGSINVYTRFGVDNPWVSDLIHYLRVSDLDIVCLQELGRLSESLIDNEDTLDPYFLLLSCDGVKESNSVGFLIKKSYRHAIRYDEKSHLIRGRLYRIGVELPGFKLSIVSGYFPTGLEGMTDDDPDFILAERMADRL